MCKFFLFINFVLYLGTALCFAQEESITLTTYYPSPYGSYKNLSIYNLDESTTQTDFTQGLNNAGINITTDYTANAFTPGIFWSTQNNNATKPKAGIYLKETAMGTYMYFGTSNNYATGITNDALVINYYGNIGIGATDPGPYRLKVNGTIINAINSSAPTSTGALIIQNTNQTVNNGVAIWFNDGAGLVSSAGVAAKFNNHTTDDVDLRLITDSEDRIYITNAGKVGIGTSNPDVKLDVDGDIEGDLLSTGSTGYVGYVSGGTQGGAYKLVRFSSSKKYKENIKDFSHGLDIIDKLRPVEFNWKMTGDKDFGFIAEEAEKINPLLVVRMNGEVETFKYMQLTAVLTNAIKELESRIEALETKLNNLKR